MEYNHKIVLFTITCLAMLIGIDGLNTQREKQELLQECVLVGKMISKSVGVSNELIEYIELKGYILEYPEKNPHNVGDVVEFSLIHHYQSLFFKNKELKVTHYVILGSII